MTSLDIFLNLGSGKNPNSKSTRPPTVRYSSTYTPPRTATGTYKGTGRRPKFVDENGNINEDLFNQDKASRVGWEDTYYKRKQSGSSYQGDEFAREAPPIPKQEYYGTVGQNSTNSNQKNKSGPGGPTAGADPFFDAKKIIAEEEAQKEKEKIDQGFIFITDAEGQTKQGKEVEKDTNIWEDIVARSQSEVDTFITDAYEQLENTPVQGPLGEISIMLRVLLGSIKKKEKDVE